MKRLPKATKVPCPHVSIPQRERIIGKFVQGKPIRQISREEGRSRGTITKIVRSQEVQSYVTDLRERYIGLGREALDSLTRALRSSKDGKLGHQILADIGVISNDQSWSTVQGTVEMDEETQVQIMMGRLVQAAATRAKVYRFSLGQMGEDLKAAGIDI
jgi:hypothetical protein